MGNAEQGFGVSLSDDGNTAIVGGPRDNAAAGAAWVYTRSRGVWNQQAKLVGTDALSKAQQGFSISLSGNGNTAIVGGPGSLFETPLTGGAAWVFTRAGGVWSQQAKLVGTGPVGDALQGYSVSLSSDGSTAIVGGPNDNNGVSISKIDGVGAAWVFARPVFAGTPGKSNCHHKSVSALAQQYGGLNNAAASLDFPSVQALQNAILSFCE